MQSSHQRSVVCLKGAATRRLTAHCIRLHAQQNGASGDTVTLDSQKVTCTIISELEAPAIHYHRCILASMHVAQCMAFCLKYGLYIVECCTLKSPA